MSLFHRPNDSDGDEWVDVTDTTTAQKVVNMPWNTADTIEFKRESHKHNSELPAQLTLENFDWDAGVMQILRCKPVKRNYPTVQFPMNYSQYESVLLTMAMFHHGLEHVDVRFPNFKDKCPHFRGRHGVWVNPSENGSIRILKKATDKTTGNHVAFRLGTDFKFHTNGIDPFFAIIATPFVNGQFKPELAIRSHPFLVKSKRKQTNEPGPHKRRKKARELQKLETDIQSARMQKASLEHDDARMTYLIQQHTQFMRHLSHRTNNLPYGPAKIALAYATQELFKKPETVSL